MEKLITFRAQCDKLNDNEFEMFCNQLLSKHDKRTLIVKSLFHLILNTLDDDDENNIVNEINEIIINIINLRKKNKSKNQAKSIIPNKQKNKQ